MVLGMATKKRRKIICHPHNPRRGAARSDVAEEDEERGLLDDSEEENHETLMDAAAQEESEVEEESVAPTQPTVRRRSFTGAEAAQSNGPRNPIRQTRRNTTHL